MAQVGEGDYRRCARCGLLKPETAQCFYFAKTGRVTGYCKVCQKAYLKAYGMGTSDYQIARRRAAQRAWWLRTHPVPPERQRARRGAA